MSTDQQPTEPQVAEDNSELEKARAKIFAVEKIMGRLCNDDTLLTRSHVYDDLHAAIYSDQDELSTHDEQRAEIEALRIELAKMTEWKGKAFSTAASHNFHREKAEVDRDQWQIRCAKNEVAVLNLLAKVERLATALREAKAALEREHTSERLRWNPGVSQWETPYDEAEQIITAALAEKESGGGGA